MKTVVVPKRIVASLLLHDGMFLIGQRGKKDLFGKWEFPGGKVEQGETDQQALIREMEEELGIIVTQVGAFFCSVAYEFKGIPMERFAYFITLFTGDLKALEHQQIRWVGKSDLINYDFPEPDRFIIQKLLGNVINDEHSKIIIM